MSSTVRNLQGDLGIRLPDQIMESLLWIQDARNELAKTADRGKIKDEAMLIYSQTKLIQKHLITIYKWIWPDNEDSGEEDINNVLPDYDIHDMTISDLSAWADELRSEAILLVDATEETNEGRMSQARSKIVAEEIKTRTNTINKLIQ